MRTVASLLALIVFTPVMKAADTDSIESLVSAVYDVISGPAGATRDWQRFRLLFADGARLVPIRVGASGAGPVVLTVEDYVKRTDAIFQKAGFYESQAAARVETFGNIAHVFSTYESRHAPGEKPFARGINSMQLVKAGNAWKVMTILWDSEREGQSIPEKYLK